MQQRPLMTFDHEIIKKWVEERGGVPAAAESGRVAIEESGVLRIRFPEQPAEEYEKLTWDQFFAKFDQAHLAFMYEERTVTGELSSFFKFISRNGE